jgi:hypothetical protein
LFPNIYCSVSCRLPQTPRTPATAAAHYFDDIFTTNGRPKKPQHLRRSSTNRSIGFRSDWDTSTNGDPDEAFASINRVNSVGYLDEEGLKRKVEMDKHVAHYINDQLERMKSNDSASVNYDEFEAQLDGPDDQEVNGLGVKGLDINGLDSGPGGYFDNDTYHGQ